MTQLEEDVVDRFPADTVEKQYRMLVGGQWVTASTGETTRCVDPYEDRAWGHVPVASAEDVDRAVRAARRAFPAWAAAMPRERARLLLRLADLVEQHVDELARTQIHENGKLITEMAPGAMYNAWLIRFCAGLAEQQHGYTAIPSIPGVTTYTVPEPIGVVAAITPWNSPLNLLGNKLFPALAAGCTVVIKPSEVTPTSTLLLAELIQEAGFPDGVVNVVTGPGNPTGTALVNHPDVDKISFTGSTATGRAIAHAAADRISRTSLELGGKSPTIVFADADLDNAVHGVMAGIFAATGQTCMAGSRVLVESSVHDEFVAKLADRAQRLVLGDPLDPGTHVGPIAFRTQLEKVLGYVDLGLEEGATLVTGGRRPDSSPELQRGLFVEPTIFTDVQNSSRMAQEEIFGPVASVIRFTGEEQAVQVANDIPFGLAAAVWTEDVNRAHRMVKQVRAGTVWVNTYRAMFYTTPFGGYKQSGLGRELGLDALDAYTEPKTVWIDHANKQTYGRTS